MQACVVLEADWREPLDVAAATAEEPYALTLLSDGSAEGRWSYVLRAPDTILTLDASQAGDAFAAAAALLGPRCEPHPDGPAFQGGLAGLASYEAGVRAEPAMPAGRHPDWPDLAVGLYRGVLAFDHKRRRMVSLGRGETHADALARATAGLEWANAAPRRGNGPPSPLARAFEAVTGRPSHEAAVAAIVESIARGDIFQANYAALWGGWLASGVQPFDLFAALAADSPAPFAGYFRLPGRALVSNSPEQFITVHDDGGGLVARTRPIKGTAPRGRDPAEDAALSAWLEASEKDRAENLMIVDLMRNDLSRLCEPGSVEVPVFCRVESFANVHHLVSTVVGRLTPGASALELMGAAFPAGSISGAPKIEAMRVIARHEPPRGPFFGSLFWAGCDGALDSNVLIRTVGLVQERDGWRFEARAGGGITADSDPAAERGEAETKMAAIKAALTGQS
ncbi:MAG: anthranilate synthase component I family protein [Caulobacteraceae bacterium]